MDNRITEMFKMRAKNYTYQQIADEFKISKQRVHTILNNKKYTNLHKNIEKDREQAKIESIQPIIDMYVNKRLYITQIGKIIHRTPYYVRKKLILSGIDVEKINAEITEEKKANKKIRTKQIRKNYYNRNREKIIEYTKKWRENNKSKALVYSKKWAENNKDKAKKTKRKYYDSHKEKLKQYAKDYYIKNKEKKNEK